MAEIRNSKAQKPLVTDLYSLYLEMEGHLLQDVHPSDYLNGIYDHPLFRQYPFDMLHKLKQTMQSPKPVSYTHLLDLLDCINLFYNGQLAICIGNLTNLWDTRDRGMDVFIANFPSLSGNGYCTTSTNGFCVFDNRDERKIQVSKDFLHFLYTDETLMKYTLGTLPVNRSIIGQYQDEIWMLGAYGENTSNVVDVVQNNLNWQSVRDVFYPNIRDLLMGTKTPAQTAAAIDASCNACLLYTSRCV